MSQRTQSRFLLPLDEEPKIDELAAVEHYVFTDVKGKYGPRGRCYVEGRSALGQFQMWLTGCYGDHPEGILYGD